MTNYKKTTAVTLSVISVLLMLGFFTLWRISEAGLKKYKLQLFTRAYEGTVAAVISDDHSLLSAELPFYFSFLPITEEDRDTVQKLLLDLAESDGSRSFRRASSYLDTLLEYLSNNRKECYRTMSLDLPDYPDDIMTAADSSYELKERLGERAEILIGGSKAITERQIQRNGRTLYLYSTPDSYVIFDISGRLISLVAENGGTYTPSLDSSEGISAFCAENLLPPLRVYDSADSFGGSIIYLKCSFAAATAVIDDNGRLKSFLLKENGV